MHFMGGWFYPALVLRSSAVDSFLGAQDSSNTLVLEEFLSVSHCEFSDSTICAGADIGVDQRLRAYEQLTCSALEESTICTYSTSMFYMSLAQ